MAKWLGKPTAPLSLWNTTISQTTGESMLDSKSYICCQGHSREERDASWGTSSTHLNWWESQYDAHGGEVSQVASGIVVQMVEALLSVSKHLCASLPNAIKISNSSNPSVPVCAHKECSNHAVASVGRSANFKYFGFCNSKFPELMSKLAYFIESWTQHLISQWRGSWLWLGFSSSLTLETECAGHAESVWQFCFSEIIKLAFFII